jgi:predicted GTPase
LGSYRKVDIALAQKIVREGRGIVMAVNKWDLVDQ